MAWRSIAKKLFRTLARIIPQCGMVSQAVASWGRSDRTRTYDDMGCGSASGVGRMQRRGFVDEPRRTVEEADKLVAAVMQRLAEGFANERSGLEKQWDSGENVSTEDLRLALQRYRSFFDRLLKL